MGACPSDLAGPAEGPPASTDEVKTKQAKVNEAGEALRKANKKLEDARTKLSGLQTTLSTTQDELNGADLRIAKRGESVASAKTPQSKDDALRKVEIEKAKKVRLEAEKSQLNMLIANLTKDITELEKTSKTAETNLATAKSELAATIQRVTDEAAAKKAADEAAAAEAERQRKEEADKAAEEADRLRQEEELKATAEAERLRQEQEDRAAAEADRLRQEEELKAAAEAARRALPLTEGQIRRAEMEVPRGFEPPEIPEGLTPEQQRRVAMGGPIPASAIKPLALPTPEQQLPTEGQLKRSTFGLPPKPPLQPVPPIEGELPPPPPMQGGRRRTYRKRRGGNDPVKSETQSETTKRELKEIPPVSPVVRGELVKKGSLPKGGRRRTFRKKKTLKQIETQLKDIQKSLANIK